MPNCDRVGCKEEAKYHPVLLLYAPLEYNFNEPIKCILGLKICEIHTRTTKIEDYLSNEGWIQICESIQKQGKILLERNRTQLSWIRIGAKVN